MAAYRKRRTVRRRRPIRRKIKRAKSRRPAMTRKRILNITSDKKHDNMRSVVRTATGTITAGSLTTGVGFNSLYMPSARPMAELTGESQRSTLSTYSVGYKEVTGVTCKTGGVWRWRRVVFSTKDSRFFDQVGDNLPYLDEAATTRSSMVRVINQLPNAQYIRVRDILFDGQEGVDWASIFTAKVDTTRVTLHSDKTININPGNETGNTRIHKNWYPTRKNLVYDGDEAGAGKDTSYLSTHSKLGMGDLYVFDVVILELAPPGGGAELTFNPQGTYYWHER
uniref:Capsid protein n=1 Tax=Luscinia cyane Genomoviridae sp. TaxID=2814965 RepID=A0A8A4XC55_9VIRU|nr:MAG: capsid protein [Gemycircularvirus]